MTKLSASVIFQSGGGAIVIIREKHLKQRLSKLRQFKTNTFGGSSTKPAEETTLIYEDFFG